MVTVLKVVLLGQAGCGKTCLITKFTTGVFDSETQTSISAQFTSKTIEFKDFHQTIKFDIWDTAGQEKYKSLAKIFYKDAKVICLCYDIANKSSFTELKEYWYENQTKLNVDGEPIYAIVANKYDLYDIQQVKDEEGKEFAKQINAIFHQTSAKSDIGINTLFEKIGKKYFEPNYDSNEIEDKEKKEYEKKKLEKSQQKKVVNNNQNRGVKLGVNKNKENKKKSCC